MLTSGWATLGDREEFAEFECCKDDKPDPWVQEAETYVRGWVLDRAEYVLAHRNESGKLVAVSAFDKAVIGLPLMSPTDHPGWHLQVVAISKDDQGQRLSRDVFDATFQAMRRQNAERVFVTANVHQNHGLSLRACASVGLTPWIPLDDEYWVLLGEVSCESRNA
jgi:hypothetical protein